MPVSPSPPSRRARTPQRGVGRPPGVAAEGTRAGGRWLAATWPPQGCSPAKVTNPAPHDPPVTAGC